MTTPWKRRRVWWFTELQNGRWVEPFTVVEFREFRILVSAPWMIGCFHYVTHYRSPVMMKGPCATEAKLLNN